MDDFLDDLLKDSDDDLPTSVTVPLPKPLHMKKRLCSPTKNNTVNQSCLGVVKNMKDDSKNVVADPFFGIRFRLVN